MGTELISQILVVGLDDTGFEMTRLAWSNEKSAFYKAETFTDAIKEIKTNKFHLVVIVLPFDNDERDFYVSQIKIMRDVTSSPIVVMSHNPFDAAFKIRVLEEGADDCLICPPTMEEAVATGKAIIRRYTDFNNKQERPITLVYCDCIVISVEHRKVFVQGQEITLQPKEFDILCMLVRNPGRVFTYEQIFHEVWGEEYIYSAKKNLRNHIEKLRKKIQIADDLPKFIKTHHSVGYSFDPEMT